MPESITPLKRFINLLKVDRQDILSVYVYALFNGIVALSLPLGIQVIINLISGGQLATSWIIMVTLVLLGIAFSGFMQIMQLTVTESIQQKIFARSAFEFAFRIPKLKLEEVSMEYIPELVNRFFDTLSVQKGLSKILIDFSSAGLQVIFGLIVLAFYHPFFVLFGLTLILIVYVIFKLTGIKGLKASLKESKYKYEVAHWLEELARAMETFKLAGKTNLPLHTTDLTVTNYLEARKEHFSILRLQFAMLVVFKVIVVSGLLIIGGILVMNDQMNIGQFVASEIIIILMTNSVEKLIVSTETIYDVLTSIEKIGNVTDIPLENRDGTHKDDIESAALSVELRNLNYTFHDSKQPVLKNMSLHLGAGESLCISGIEGAGKTILLQLIAGLYENFDGNILYQGIPLKNWCKEDLYSSIGDHLYKQDIFKGTIRQNITLGRDGITEQRIRSLCSLLELDEFLKNLPKGLDSLLFPEGTSIPSRVRLKILLIRGVLTRPKLVLLDDHFNSLEFNIRSKFIDYLLKEKLTLICVSNKVSVAKKMDTTVILDEGRIIQRAHFDELEKNDLLKLIFRS